MRKNRLRSILNFLKRLRAMLRASACVRRNYRAILRLRRRMGLEMIISCVEQEKEADFRMKFDPTLVRGMSYYTGTIFEISHGRVRRFGRRRRTL